MLDPSVLGAFLSGVGSVIGGWWALRTVRRRAEERCRERIEEVRKALVQGFQEGRR